MAIRHAAVVLALLTTMAPSGGAASTAAVRPLTPLPIDPQSVTVSGLSSGGAMAVQFHTAFSSLVQGAGVLAGIPYLCAEGSVQQALGRCMKDGTQIPAAQLQQQADRLAGEGKIDPAAGLAGDRVWLYRGAQDPYVNVTVVDALEAYYRARAGATNVVRVERAGASHNFPTRHADAADCTTSTPPYIANCGFDGAHELLEQMYGPLAAAADSPALAPLIEFDQRPYAATAGSTTLADHGWLYVPATCSNANATTCRLHVVFHGCKQGASEVGDAFVRRAGYLEVADANRIVLLFPQVKPTLAPLNPLGCWDWWGIEGADYATRDGKQMRAVRAMIGALLGEPAAGR
jgi:poly(3-hydroxybutyrate) depolymerase